jgi:hypothetical protein
VAFRNMTRVRLEQSGSLEIAGRVGLIQKHPGTSVGFESQQSRMHGHCRAQLIAQSWSAISGVAWRDASHMSASG